MATSLGRLPTREDKSTSVCATTPQWLWIFRLPERTPRASVGIARPPSGAFCARGLHQLTQRRTHCNHAYHAQHPNIHSVFGAPVRVLQITSELARVYGL